MAPWAAPLCPFGGGGCIEGSEHGQGRGSLWSWGDIAWRMHGSRDHTWPPHETGGHMSSERFRETTCPHALPVVSSAVAPGSRWSGGFLLDGEPGSSHSGPGRHNSVLIRDDSKPRHSFRRGEVSWTPHILPAEAGTSQAAGRQAAVHPQPQGHSRRRATGNPSTGSNRVSETQDKGPCDCGCPLPNTGEGCHSQQSR